MSTFVAHLAHMLCTQECTNIMVNNIAPATKLIQFVMKGKMQTFLSKSFSIYEGIEENHKKKKK